MLNTSTNSSPLTRQEYLQFRNRYIPTEIKIIFVLESPPASGKYFYNPSGSTSEPLFRAMITDVLEIKATSKEEGLKQFADRGYFLLDATYTPVNHLKGKARDAIILRDFPLLVADMREHARSETAIVLVKANICKLLEPKLKEVSFNVLNRGTVIPFPSSGQQPRFCNAVRAVMTRCRRKSLL